MITHNCKSDEADCIPGEMVVNLLTGEKYEFGNHAQECHWPLRLIESGKRKLLLIK